MAAQTEKFTTFIIQSKIDDQKFEINRKIIDSSSLLKNICDITEITTNDPILVDCCGASLKFFITLINNYETLEDEHDYQFENNLFNSFAPPDNKQQLIKLIQDSCILDSDFFLDSAADYILGILEKEKMDWKNIQKYLGLENDFTKKERKLIRNLKKYEYFFSIDTGNFKFPFSNKNLYSLKTDFSTPMNVLIARIVQRSNAKMSYLLSIINKTMKNEVDRHPLKLSKFSKYTGHWTLGFPHAPDLFLNIENHSEEYFNILKKRNISTKQLSALYDDTEDSIYQTSLEFAISETVKITFRNFSSIYLFDVKQCRVQTIFYNFGSVKERFVKFEDLHNHLIAKDASKKIQLCCTYDMFKFFYPYNLLRFYKKPNVSKWNRLKIYNYYIQKINPEFKKFIANYMEDDGIIESRKFIPGIPSNEISSVKVDTFYIYPVSVLKKYLECIVTK